LVGLPDLPLTSPGWVFAVLMAVVLLAPIAAERVRLPGIVGLILAGVLVGPHTFGILQRDGAIALLGGIGLLYLMFVAGLELDLDGFSDHRRASLVFGVLTFSIPMVLGAAVSLALGYSILASLLIASCWASHTLVAYPVYRRARTTSSRAVSVAVGATIITDTAALVVLAVVASAHQGALSWGFWLTLAGSLTVLFGATLWLLPRLTRWFFAGLGQERAVRFLFVMVALFVSAGLAEVAGIEPIVGAFLAGLALNRLVPNGGPLMDRIEFLGATLLIPVFLVTVGMLVDPAAFLAFDRTLLVAGAFVAVALASKWLGAQAAGRLFAYSRPERSTLFSLSAAQAAATLAAIIVGFDIGLIGLEAVNAAVVVILVTCLVSSWVAARTAPSIPRPPVRARALGQTILVPIVRPESVAPLIWLAAALARVDSGTVIPLAVVGGGADDEEVALRRETAAGAERHALATGADSHGLLRIDTSVADGILHAAREELASLVLLGWKGFATAREHLFGGVIDPVLATSSVPIAVARLQPHTPRRVVLALETGDLEPAVLPSLHLATELVRRIARTAGLEVVLATDVDLPQLTAVTRGLQGLRVGQPLACPRSELPEAVDTHDLVVLPAAPGPAALRGSAAAVAHDAPQVSVVIALNPGVRPLAIDPAEAAVREEEDV
jgi:Kef-type K+ transport system membrane component KefB